MIGKKLVVAAAGGVMVFGALVAPAAAQAAPATAGVAANATHKRSCRTFHGSYKGVHASIRRCTNGKWTKAKIASGKRGAHGRAVGKWYEQHFHH